MICFSGSSRRFNTYFGRLRELTQCAFLLVKQVSPHRLISGLKLFKVTAGVVLHDIYQLGGLPSEALNAAVSLSSFPVEAAVISTAAAELASSRKWFSCIQPAGQYRAGFSQNWPAFLSEW